MTNLLKLDNICKDYGNGDDTLEVLKDFSMEISRGELLAITGSSGSGKSTLMHIIGGLDRPTCGTVQFENVDIYKLPPKELDLHRNKNVGFVFQFHYLLDDFTAVENVMVPALLAGKSNIEAKDRAMYLLDKVGLSGRASHLPKEMSGGEQQRTAIARALINEPSLLLADEPTGSLDRANSEIVEELLLGMNKKDMTVIIVTHDQKLAQKCTRNVHLEKA